MVNFPPPPMTPDRHRSGPPSPKEQPYEILLRRATDPAVEQSRTSTRSMVLESLDDRITPSVTDPTFEAGSRTGGGADTMAIDQTILENGQAATAHISNDRTVNIRTLTSQGVPSAYQSFDLPGSDARSVSFGDRDGDGKIDVNTAMYGSGEIVTLRGNGDGTFQEPEVIGGAGGNPRSVFLARTAGQSGADTIVVDQSADALYTVTKNNHQEMIPVGDFPLDGAAIDINHDGREDLVIVHRTGQVMTLLSTGNGRYQQAGSVNLGALGYTVTAYEENGQMYVIAATQNHTLVTYTVNTSGALQRIGSIDNVGGQHIYTLKAVDFNGDNVRDLVASLFWQRSNTQGGVSVLTGLGNGEFGSPQILQDNQQVIGVSVGAFTPGGQPGIVSASIQGGIQTYRNATPLPEPLPPTPEEIAAASQPDPDPGLPPEEAPPSSDAIAAAFAAAESNPVLQEILSGLTEGNRFAAAHAIPVLEFALTEAENSLSTLQQELHTVLVRRHQNQATDWDVEQAQNRMNGAANRITRLENALIAAQDLFAREETEVPLRNTVSILGVNRNKLVLRVFVLEGQEVQPEIMLNGPGGWVRLELGATVTRDEEQSFVTVSVPFHGTMNGTVTMDGNRMYRVSVLVDGQRIEEESLYAQWHPALRTLQLLPESFPRLLDASIDVAVVPDAEDLAVAQAESAALVMSVAPHIEPVTVGEYSIARNVASSIWSAVGLLAFTNELLASAKNQVLQQRFAQIYALGGHPGAFQEEQVWNEVFDASERLLNAASDYHTWLMRRDAGEEPGIFDFSRFQCSYPGFPTAEQIRECLECRCSDANAAVEMRKAEESAYYQMILNWTHRVSEHEDPADTNEVSDAAFNHTVNVILLSHAAAPADAIVPLHNYARSVGRELSWGQLAAFTGTSEIQVRQTLGFTSSLVGYATDTQASENTISLVDAREAVNNLPLSQLQIIAFSWFRNSALEFEGQKMRTDTVAGRILTGLFQSAADTSIGELRLRIAIAERLLGVSGELLQANFAITTSDPSRSFRTFWTTCAIAGLDHLFVPSTASSSIAPEKPEVAKVILGAFDHTDPNAMIPVKFDLLLPQNFSTTTNLYSGGTFYLLSEFGFQIGMNHQGGGIALTPLFQGGYTAKIPMQSLAYAGINGNLAGAFRLKLALLQSTGENVEGLGGGTNREAEIFVNVMFPQSVSTITASINDQATEDIARQYVADFDALDAQDKQRVLEALSFTGLSPDRAKATATIKFLLEHFLGQNASDEHKAIWDSQANAWVGTPYESFQEGQCKYWLQQLILKDPEVGINIGKNMENAQYQWVSNTDVIAIATGHTESDEGTLGTVLSELAESKQLLTGDMVQYTLDNYQHTFLIGSVTAEGIWVFDSNFGEGRTLPNGTETDDLTPRYHFFSWNKLNQTLNFTLYRINE